jgi:predicted adenine nucleotide alpha hydrolase (AANH) superfamily ATPase
MTTSMQKVSSSCCRLFVYNLSSLATTAASFGPTTFLSNLTESNEKEEETIEYKGQSCH